MMDEINKLPLNLRHLITHWLKFLVRHILRPILIHHMVGDWLRWHRLYRLLELRLLHEMMLLLVHLVLGSNSCQEVTGLDLAALSFFKH